MDTPTFHVPGVPDEDAEATLETFASRIDAEVPPSDRRVYRIEWTHDGQRWTAEVGRQMRGKQVTRTHRGRPGARLTDPATVLAIFPGRPWKVVNDARPIGDVRSAWANPFLVGRPDEVDYFTAP